jgi:hypothetical protein
MSRKRYRLGNVDGKEINLLYMIVYENSRLITGYDEQEKV